MPRSEEDPERWSIPRLRAHLVAHDVALPPAKSRKDVYVALHVKHIDPRHREFSSDDEEQAPRVENVQDHDAEVAEMPDPGDLTDEDLKDALLQRGVKAGPIVASTRALYERKLSKLLQSKGPELLNGAESGVLYSDSEEEEQQEDGESGSEGATEETVEQAGEAQDEGSERAASTRNQEPTSVWNSGNVMKSWEQSGAQRPQIHAGLSRASSGDPRSGLGSGMESRKSLSPSTERGMNGSKEHGPGPSRASGAAIAQPTPGREKDHFKKIVPETLITPSGTYSLCRRPIKGAAGRPVQHADRDVPASPTTLERREVQRRLVPIHIQILLFIILACFLYLIHALVQDDFLGAVTSLLDGLNLEPGAGEGLQDAPQLSGLE